MASFNPPKEQNGIPLSDRSQWLLYAPTWMLFPVWRKRVMEQPIVNYMLRWELRQ